MFPTKLFFAWLIVIIANVFASQDDDMQACLEVFDVTSIENQCCESLKGTERFAADIEDCLPKKREDFACTNMECILKKQKLISGNKVDNDAALKMFQDLTKEFPKEKAAIERVSRECLDSKYMEYGPDGDCPAMNFFICAHLHSNLECESWKKTDICTKMSENAKKCKAAIEAAK